MFIILIIVSSFLFAGEFNKKITRLKDDKYLNISIALNRSIEKMTDETSCIIYPNDNLAFRAATPTLIDIAISVFVVGKNRFSANESSPDLLLLQVFFGMKSNKRIVMVFKIIFFPGIISSIPA